MGQKVHPEAMRLGYIKSCKSVWYAGNDKDYMDKLHTDIAVREFLFKKLSQAFVSKIIIERPADTANIVIFTARPGIVIGKKGEDIDRLRKEVMKIMRIPVYLNIEEIKTPELEARLVAESIARQLEKRIIFRRAMKRALQSTMKVGAKGIKICIGGRIGGAEIARKEWCKEGRIPLHTLRADIDYYAARALTTYGIIGVKVWIFKGETSPGNEHRTEQDKRKR
ncbi:MAG: 30S ribosomal protein S3 [Thiotrichales bacterium]|nr:MAG: 30S ribosomal protein S3 [Thiotrichales bacterium]